VRLLGPACELLRFEFRLPNQKEALLDNHRFGQVDDMTNCIWESMAIKAMRRGRTVGAKRRIFAARGVATFARWPL